MLLAASSPRLSCWLAAALLLAVLSACATPPVKLPEGPFYATPEITYLLDRPGPDGNILGPLYRGDQVALVAVGRSDWWQVKPARSGQAGWLRKELLSPDPVAGVFYYVNEDTLPLRECPGSDCLPVQLLSRAEQVQKIQEGEGGWWRVLALDSRSLGWAPAAALTDRLEEARETRSRKPYYYVAVTKLNLRAKPSPRGEVVRVLKFNEQLQEIGQAEGWLKVRQPSSGAMGWVAGKEVETLPLVRPRDAAPAKKELRPFKQQEESLVEPEFM